MDPRAGTLAASFSTLDGLLTLQQQVHWQLINMKFMSASSSFLVPNSSWEIGWTEIWILIEFIFMSCCIFMCCCKGVQLFQRVNIPSRKEGFYSKKTQKGFPMGLYLTVIIWLWKGVFPKAVFQKEGLVLQEKDMGCYLESSITGRSLWPGTTHSPAELLWRYSNCGVALVVLWRYTRVMNFSSLTFYVPPEYHQELLWSYSNFE